MKKSEIYNMTQIAVLTSPLITPENKLEILRVLIADEDLEKFMEESKEKDCDAE